MVTGRLAIVLVRSRLKNWLESAVNNSGAVSPATRAGASSTPGMRPRRADADADPGHDDRTDDGVHQAAFGRSRWRGVLGEDLQIEPCEAVIEQREQDQGQPGHAEQRSSEA